jgi:AcrR family transcriptional regulator
MARRQARFAPQDLKADVRLQDQSQDLWRRELGEVAQGLLTSAVRCFAANGYHATTTRDIATLVGLSPAALYVHFPSKEIVLYEIIRSSHEKALACVETGAADETLEAPERLGQLVAGYTAWHGRHHVAARVAQYELAGLTAEHYAEITKLRDRTNEVFREAVARGIDDGSFAPVDVNRVVRAILSLSIDLVRWYRLSGPDSPEEIGAFYSELALKMVQHHALPGRSRSPGAESGGAPRRARSKAGSAG